MPSVFILHSANFERELRFPLPDRNGPGQTFSDFYVLSSSTHSLCCYHTRQDPPFLCSSTSVFATHMMALCCPALWLMVTIQCEKFPWGGASWLKQRRNSLLLSAELIEEGSECVCAHVDTETRFGGCQQVHACLSAVVVEEPSSMN